MKIPIKLLLPSPHGDSLLIEPKRTMVYFKIKCDDTGFIVCVDKWKLKELFMFSDAKTIPAIRKCPKKLGMRFHK
jgi:hypothetical protein